MPYDLHIYPEVREGWQVQLQSVPPLRKMLLDQTHFLIAKARVSLRYF